MTKKHQLTGLVIIIVILILVAMILDPQLSKETAYKKPNHDVRLTRTLLPNELRNDNLKDYLKWHINDRNYLYDSYNKRNLKINNFETLEAKVSMEYPNMSLSNKFYLEDKILLEVTWARDFIYSIYDPKLDNIETIVGIIENARFQRQENSSLIFYAKGGDDTGNYQFPYIINYDLNSGNLKYKELYVRRDAVFGAPFSWKHELVDVNIDHKEILLKLVVPKGQILTGGHRIPFTITEKNENTLSIRIFGVIFEENAWASFIQDEGIIERVDFKETSKPIENSELLRESYPFGAMMENVSIDRESILIEISTHSDFYYSVETILDEQIAKYIIKIDVDEVGLGE